MSTVSSKSGSLRAGCTVRAFVTGCLACAAVGVIGPYAVIIRKGSYLFLDFASPGPFGLFFYLILANSLVRAWGRRRLVWGWGWAAVAAGVAAPALAGALAPWPILRSWGIAVLIALGAFAALSGLIRLVTRGWPIAWGGAILVGLCVSLVYFVLSGRAPTWIAAGWDAAVLALVVASAAALFRVLRPRWALDSAELLVVMIMMLVGGSVVTMGYMLQIFSFISAGRFFADASNEYGKYILANTPPWMMVNDETAVRWFYEGLPKGASIPWMSWVKPFLGWLPLILAVYWVMVSLMVMVRRQWAENERLVYPQAQLPLAMVEDADGRRPFPPLFRNILFWIGFGIAFSVSSLNGLHHYFSSVPVVTMSTSIPMFRGAAWLSFRLSFPWIGFAYLLNLDVGLSLWLFALIAFVQRGIFNVRGIKSEEFLGIYGANETPILAHQGMGALIAFLVVVLWTGRRHLADVFRKAIRNDPAIDDSGEMMSYRAALVGVLAGSAVVWGWMTLAGLPLWLGPLFVILVMVIFFVLTRVVVQGGFPTVRPPSLAAPMLLSGLGSSVFGPAGIVALCHTYAWAADIRTFPMVPAAHAGRISERIGRKRPVSLALWLAILVTLAVSFFATLSFTHVQGGLNANTWFFGSAQKWAFDYGVTRIRELERVAGVDGVRLGEVRVSVIDGVAADPGILRLEGAVRSVAVGGELLCVDEIGPVGGPPAVDFEDLPAGAQAGPGETLPTAGRILTVEAWDVQGATDTEAVTGSVSVREAGQAGGTGQEIEVRGAVVAMAFDPPLDGLQLRFRSGGRNVVLRVNGEARSASQFKAAGDVFADGRIDSTRPYARGYLHKAIGAGVMTVLVLLRNRFYWWPVHPIGYLVGADWLVQQVWISVLFTWIVKALVLKLGGARAYRRLIPLFLGVILGQFVSALTWVGIDGIYRETGNLVFWF